MDCGEYVLRYLQSHFAEPVSIQNLADRLQISRSTLTGQFQKKHGVSPTAYLMQRRLETAAEMLSETPYSVDEIAQRCGLRDTSYLSRVFKRQYGVSPGAYRRASGNMAKYQAQYYAGVRPGLSDEGENLIRVENMGRIHRYYGMPGRIVCLDYCAAEICAALGIADRMTGIASAEESLLDCREEYRPQLGKIPFLSGRSLEVNVPSFEAVCACRPDMVIGTGYSFQRSGVAPAEMFEEKGIHVYAMTATFSVGCGFDSVYRDTVERKKDSGWLLAALLIILLGALAVSIVSGVFLGSANMDGKTVIDVLLMKLFGKEAPELNKAAVSIVWELRLPRVLLAIAVGGGLAVAGAAMQAVTTNVMADPYILGASSGASAAVALAFFLGGTFAHSGVFISTFAFGGAMLALILVYAIGMTGGSASSNRLVLAGMAISVILTAVTHFFISMAPDEHTAKSITSWTMGSLATARWDNIGFPILSTLIGSLTFILISRAFNLLSQGDETAVSLGVNVHLLKRVTIILVSLITGAAVSAGGVIGFVGFIIPHIVRMLLGADHRRVFPFSYLIGGLFLMWMDVLARTVIAPKELPIGVFTAFCGGPFFVWLLFRKKQPGKKARRVRHGE